MKVALSIAGSDSSGASGIQADLRAFASLRVPGAGAITAITSQGSNGVDAVQLVSPEVLESQIQNAFAMYDIGAVKIGMLGSEEQVNVVAKAMAMYRPEHIVLDPVIASTSGTRLLTDEGIRALLAHLVPVATVLTPNLDELATLSGLPTATEAQAIRAAQCLLDRGAQSVVVKGGHFEGEPRDILVNREGTFSFAGQRVETEHSRGTGCVFSALIAARRIHESLESAITKSKIALEHGLQYPLAPKSGRGYPVLDDRLSHEDRLRMLSGIYFVTDSNLKPDITHAIGSRLALQGGASIVQLRDKSDDLRSAISIAKRIRNTCDSAEALFIVNDRVDIALAAEADGVHLGPEDMGPEEARLILGPSRLVGVSVSTVEEAESIGDFASYLAVGAIFGSSTKGDAGDAVGVERITQIKNACPDKKIVAIGGINRSNIASVAAAGADAAAVISAIVCAADPEQATRELLAEFERGRRLSFGE